VTAAKSLKKEGEAIHLVVFGPNPPSRVPEGVTKVVHYTTTSSPASANNATSEALASAIASAAQHALSSGGKDDDPPTFVVGNSTKFGSTVLPRTAAMLNVSPVTDIVRIESPGTFLLRFRSGCLGSGGSFCGSKGAMLARPHVTDLPPPCFARK
jgi:electron transfer flavoprotein alpha subunit